MPESAISGIAAFLDRAGAFMADRRARRALRREIDALSPSERARVLDDTFMDYGLFARAMHTPFIFEDLNARAIRAIGADPEEFRASHAEWSRDMQLLCMACPARRQCRRDLGAGVFGRQYRHYCPNSDNLGEIAAAKTARAYPASSAAVI